MTLLRGLLFAALTVLIAVLLPRPQAMRLLAMLLASAAAVYVGMALVDGRPSILAVESGGFVVFLVLALLGLWVTPVFLAVGYLTHGLWDLLHHARARFINP